MDSMLVVVGLGMFVIGILSAVLLLEDTVGREKYADGYDEGYADAQRGIRHEAFGGHGG